MGDRVTWVQVHRPQTDHDGQLSFELRASNRHWIRINGSDKKKWDLVLSPMGLARGTVDTLPEAFDLGDKLTEAMLLDDFELARGQMGHARDALRRIGIDV